MRSKYLIWFKSPSEIEKVKNCDGDFEPTVEVKEKAWGAAALCDDCKTMLVETALERFMALEKYS